jgi:phenylpropionate dioxygenase-like ring-hydroxylating dioxygenase large terminal subunit
MYPFSEGQVFVRNAWYMAAWSTEVGECPLGRTIMDEPIVFFRDSEGQASAMWGLCAHRHYPLAGADVVGDRLVCPYHGFEYDGQGGCAHIPAQAHTPRQFRLKTYPLVERYDALWVWMGDPALADPAEIPALERIGWGVEGWRSQPNAMTYLKARWPLIVDNLMDLSHIGFLHRASLQQPDAGEATPEAEGPPEYRVIRWVPDQSPDVPYHRFALPQNTEPLDAMVTSRFFSSAMIITSNYFFSPQSRGDRRLLAETHHLHGVTPETASTTHDFSAVTRNVEVDNEAFDEFQRAIAHKARAEDVEALEKIEPMLDRYADVRRELAGVGDISGIAVRRHLAALIAAEQAETLPMTA